MVARQAETCSHIYCNKLTCLTELCWWSFFNPMCALLAHVMTRKSGHQQILTVAYVVFLTHSTQMYRQYLKTGHDLFIPHSSQFIFQYHTIIQRCTLNWITTSFSCNRYTNVQNSPELMCRKQYISEARTLRNFQYHATHTHTHTHTIYINTDNRNVSRLKPNANCMSHPL